MSVAFGTMAVNAAVGAAAYVEGTTVQNAIDVPNGEPPVPITIEGALMAGALNGAAGALVQPLPSEGMRTIAQASYIAPGRTINSMFSASAINNLYIPFAQSGLLASGLTTMVQPYVESTADSQCVYDENGFSENASCALSGDY
jgi:hypothetical protein